MLSLLFHPDRAASLPEDVTFRSLRIVVVVVVVVVVCFVGVVLFCFVCKGEDERSVVYNSG